MFIFRWETFLGDALLIKNGFFEEQEEREDPHSFFLTLFSFPWFIPSIHMKLLRTESNHFNKKVGDLKRK